MDISIKDFNFVGIGSISISIYNIKTDIALQPFMVSKAEDGVYEAIALNFGILASGTNEKEAIENMAGAILTYAMSYISSEQPVQFLKEDEQLTEFIAEYVRLSVIQKTQDVSNYTKTIKENVSTATNYYRVA